MYVILGIGNPGKQYENTKHNIGFISLDYLAANCGIQMNKIKHKAQIGEGNLAGEKVILVKPQTYVNLSGESVRSIMDFYKLTPDKLIVIYDDVSLAQGMIRIRAKGSDGGHNGIKSIIYHLQSDAFCRIKLGVGTPPEHYDLADWVLSKFSKSETDAINEALCDVFSAADMIVGGEIESAMNKFN